MSFAKGHWSKDNSFSCISVTSDGIIGIALVSDEMIKDKTPFSFLAVRRGSDWLEGGATNWDSVALSATQRPLNQFVMIGPQGEVHVTGAGDRHAESIKDGEISPSKYGLIRKARNIGDTVFACGMKKQVYRRDGANTWTCISKDIVGGTGVHGFESLDGFAPNDVYAVGWSGEIWHFDGAAWQNCYSPYNELLTDVCCADNGIVYAIGRGCTIVEGRDNSWTARGTELPIELTSLCWFKGKLYAASSRDLFELNENGKFIPIQFGDDYPETCGALATNKSILVSLGAKDLFSFDGSSWTRLD